MRRESVRRPNPHVYVIGQIYRAREKSQTRRPRRPRRRYIAVSDTELLTVLDHIPFVRDVPKWTVIADNLTTIGELVRRWDITTEILDTITQKWFSGSPDAAQELKTHAPRRYQDPVPARQGRFHRRQI